MRSSVSRPGPRRGLASATTLSDDVTVASQTLLPIGLQATSNVACVMSIDCLTWQARRVGHGSGLRAGRAMQW